MMKKYYISKNYRDKYTASSKAKYDCEDILEKAGYCNLGLSRKYIQNKWLGRLWTLLSAIKALLFMPSEGVLVLQYPVNYFDKFLKKANAKGLISIVIVHDIYELRHIDTFADVKKLSLADAIISQTPAMTRWLSSKAELKNTKIETLSVFDYLQSSLIKKEREYNKIISIDFAGNLVKASFFQQLDFDNQKIHINLYGIAYDSSLDSKKFIDYKGAFHPDDLPANMMGMFGLVWDGESIDFCSGIDGEYLKYNSPHKLSLYLSIGMPVIVWSESAMAQFVEDNKIGISISSLSQLENLSNIILTDDYKQILNNVKLIQERILNGQYLLDALNRVI